MRHLSLFSGIGGFDLASEWMGWENVAHCEINPFCQRILKYYWPNAESFTDIKTTDFTKFNGSVDIVSGGFPCQPFSTAGKREGTNDERHLWPEMLRAIREISPTWVVGENVRGLVNWSEGLVFDQVQADLEAEGYEVLPFLLPACGVGAPHRRERIWFVAYAGGNGHRDRFEKAGCETRKNESQEQRKERDKTFWEWSWDNTERINVAADDSNANGFGLERRGYETKRKYPANRNTWNQFPTQSPVCDGNDGISTRLDGITFPKWRAESIKGGGNAVVPQIPFKIFQAIEQYKLTQ